MPNTLAHLFVQGVATRSLLRGADLRWICLGCVIPDLPWILQRVVWRLNLAVLSPYDLRLYVIVQSSLIACLVLCGAFAMLSVEPRRVQSEDWRPGFWGGRSHQSSGADGSVV